MSIELHSRQSFNVKRRVEGSKDNIAGGQVF